ncbi:MAG: DUF218 domain-containing protein [Bosea sp.]|nr:DUF218 domain-containing protein [Bosea sp. (in: a-proteobacteria)]
MFFYLSKIFWLVAAPTHLLVLVAALGILLLFTRFMRQGRLLALAGVAGLLIIGATPVGRMLTRPLEDRFPRPDVASGITGMIVLGGAIGTARGEVVFNEAATRMTASIELAHRFPGARIAFTGGSAALIGRADMSEAEAARRFYLSQGIAAERLILEDKSRNTRQNAILLKPLLRQKPGERWLLVTSASHMPRSVGIFRKAGIEVIPYPVDFTTSGTLRDFIGVNREFVDGLKRTDNAVREWVGLLAYRLVGYTDAILPSPSPGSSSAP